MPADVALEFGNAYSLRLLQGAAHYVYLMTTTAENDGEKAAFEVTNFGQYWLLMRTCLRLRSTPPIDLAACKALGIAEWHRSYNFPFNSSSPDLLGLLQKIQQSLRAWCDEDLGPGSIGVFGEGSKPRRTWNRKSSVSETTSWIILITAVDSLCFILTFLT
jgi:hypothetical protein